MNRRRWVSVALLAGVAMGVAGLAGCAGPQVSDYARESPKLELDRYFNGRVRAHGVVQKRGGEVTQRFSVVIDCRWEGDQGVLDEAFTYTDGSTQRRVWRLTKHAGGRYTGRADDVIGEAEGQVSGNAFHWKYTLRVPVGEREVDLQFDDWMFLVDDRVLLNRATMSKFGVRVGDVTVSFQKE